MIIHTLIVGIVETNCYIVETDNKNAVIIDCGDEADRILQFVEEKGLTVKQIFLTHGHFDHICAVADIVLKTGAEVFVHEKDAPMLINANLSLASAVPVIKFKPVANYNLISDGDVIALDELEFVITSYSIHYTKLYEKLSLLLFIVNLYTPIITSFSFSAS